MIIYDLVDIYVFAEKRNKHDIDRFFGEFRTGRFLEIFDVHFGAELFELGFEETIAFCLTHEMATCRLICEPTEEVEGVHFIEGGILFMKSTRQHDQVMAVMRRMYEIIDQPVLAFAAPEYPPPRNRQQAFDSLNEAHPDWVIPPTK